MYVSRKAARNHGTYQFHIALMNCVFVAGLMAFVSNPLDILVIFLSSSLLYAHSEWRMHKTGVRKAQVHVYGRELSGAWACIMRGVTEGPACCVPAFFLADSILRGQPLIGFLVASASMLIISGYSGRMDQLDLAKLPPEQRGIIGRRKMNSPRLLIAVPTVTALALSGMFLLLPEPVRVHCGWYLLSSFWIVGLFFIVNGLMGVRLIEVDDEKTGKIVPASRVFNIVGFAYDALFEMSFLFVLFYLISYELGLLKFHGVIPAG